MNELPIILSIIIPVYNVRTNLEVCISSLLNQERAGCEIILVDDGSTDGSGELCDEFSKYPEVQVIHQKNKGLSSARNRGIEVSSGRYVMFLDSDDYLDDGCISKVCKVAVEKNPDMIEFAWRYVLNGVASKENSHCHPKEKLLEKEYIKQNIIPELINITKRTDKFIYDFVWEKVYKRRVLEEQHIRFDESRRKWEDRPFNVTFLRYAENIYFIKECFYNYVGGNPNSLGRSFDKDIFEVIISNFNLYKYLWGADYNFDTDYVKKYWFSSVHNQIMAQFRYIDEGKTTKSEVTEMLKNCMSQPQIKKWFLEYKDSDAKLNKIIRLVENGRIDDAISQYYKFYLDKNCKEKKANIIYGKIIFYIKKIIRK